MDAFFYDNWGFTNYSTEHFITLLICFIVGLFLIKYAPNIWSPKSLRLVMIIFSILIWTSQVGKAFIRIYLGNFEITQDLPMELCNILTFLMPIVFIFNSRLLWSTIIFWILAGTFQALFTPTLHQSFPNYEFWRYFLVHAGLVICALFPIFNWGWKLTLKDALRSAVALNILAFIMYHINNAMGANYMYMNHKPPGATLYSLLSDWPYYILQLELVLIVLFSLILLPFYLVKRS